jgi:hypothetical protein
MLGAPAYIVGREESTKKFLTSTDITASLENYCHFLFEFDMTRIVVDIQACQSGEV